MVNRNPIVTVNKIPIKISTERINWKVLKMVRKKMFERIQKLKKMGRNKKEISKELDIDPATVKKYYSMSEVQYRSYMQKLLKRKKLYSFFKNEIMEIYCLNDHKVLNMAAVYDYLEEKYNNLPGNEQTLRNYINYLKNTGELTLSKGLRVFTKVPPLPYGKQLQIDFGQYITKSRLKLYIFAAVLSASRYKYISLQDKPFTTLDLIYHLIDCFDYIGGMPEELVIDQDSIIVASENAGDIIYTEKFSSFIEEMKLKMYVCRKSDPQSKGKIENVIKYVKYNFLNVRDFDNIEEARESLLFWLNRRGNGKISKATKRIPLSEIGEERKYLRPLKNSIFRKENLFEKEIRKVSDKGFIMYGSSEYSVPEEYRGRTVEVFKKENTLHIQDEKSKKEIADHSLSIIQGERIINHSHFRAKTFDIRQLHEKTLNLYPFESWKEFVKLNIKTFSRFSRDQCLIAQKHLSKVADEGILEMAVDYCLLNKCTSMSDLKDRYIYQLKEHREDEKYIHSLFTGKTFNLKYNPPIVNKRSIDDYESVVTSYKGVNR